HGEVARRVGGFVDAIHLRFIPRPRQVNSDPVLPGSRLAPDAIFNPSDGARNRPAFLPGRADASCIHDAGKRGDVVMGKGEGLLVTAAVAAAHGHGIALWRLRIELQVMWLGRTQAPVGTGPKRGPEHQGAKGSAKIGDEARNVHADATPVQLQHQTQSNNKDRIRALTQQEILSTGANQGANARRAPTTPEANQLAAKFEVPSLMPYARNGAFL